MSTPTAHASASTAAVDLNVSDDDIHRHRRRFVGPLPESVVSQVVDSRTPQKKAWFSIWAQHEDGDEDDDAGLRDAIKDHALQFFLRHGGKKEDWGDVTERHVHEEMLKRWRESEWGRLRRKRKDVKPVNGKQWVGTSFDVGDFLGVDMLGGDAPKPASAEPSIVDEYPPPSHAPTSTVGTDFVTAPSTLSRPNGVPTQPSDASLRVLNAQSRLSAHGHEEDSRPISADSSTALLPPRIVVEDPFGGVHSEILARSLSSVGPILTSGESDTNLITGQASGKGKRVHYVDTPLPAPSPTGAPAEDPPAPAEEVLARTGSEVLDTSAGAVEQSSLQNQEKWGDVIMRDRMLVRVSYTDATTVGADFDESQDRVNPHIHSDNWMEYIVAWRKDRLELYRDHVTPGKEWLTGHKHLAFVIPMEFTTHLSIYSFIDLTFCLTCPPTPLRARSKNRALLYATRKGTNIFIFKSKSRTRAVDWVWHLWRHMGGSLPPFIEIRIPALDTRMKIDIPGGSEGNIEGAYAIFNRANVLALCRRALSQSKQHDIYAQRILAEGSSLELAWRIDTSLDWVWQTEDVEGNPRDWSVLCGLALTQGRKPAHLELRRREHLPNRLYLKDGTYLDEPPSIEGFVDRIRPSTQFKQSIYLSTHDGYLFSLPINQAYPPMPPGPRIDAKDAESLHASEVHRGTEQIMHSIGALDLRAIVAIRRAIQHVPVQTANVTPASNWEDGAEFWAEVDTTDEDDLDKGGEEGFVAASDKAKLKVRRSFELLLISGRVIRFETYSCAVALEWITRLRQLVSYWRKRHQTDARQEMDLAHHVAGKPQLTPHARISDGTPDSPPDPDASLPDLSRFFNWCVLDGCRAILKCGRLFGRKGLRGMYKHILLVLVAGHVVQFRITGESALHRRRKSINLLDAYVCSGYLAAQHLPEGQFNPNSPPLARRYQDGLESDESEEDTLFVLWYRPNTGILDQTLTLAGSSQTPPSAGKMEIPPLDAKRKLGVFRTRSKLERDAWVWAINAEIDKTVRLAKERESKVRDAGMLMTT